MAPTAAGPLRFLTLRTFDSDAFGPPAAVYLAAVFAARVFRLEAVRRRRALRLSVACFALFLALPCVTDREAVLLARSDGLQGEARLFRRGLCGLARAGGLCKMNLGQGNAPETGLLCSPAGAVTRLGHCLM